MLNDDNDSDNDHNDAIDNADGETTTINKYYSLLIYRRLSKEERERRKDATYSTSSIYTYAAAS